MSQSNALRRSEAYAEPAAQAFSIRPLAAVTGAEIIGIDLSRELTPADFTQVHRAHLDHHLLVFRDQRITPQQHVDFSRRFGRLMIHVLHQFHLPGHPEILIVSNIVEDGKPIGLGDAGKYWHSDISYKELPSLGSLLHAQELPAQGGDTLFADMHVAYDTLPAALRDAIEGKRAVHSYLAKYGQLQKEGSCVPTSARNRWRRCRKWCIRSCARIRRRVGARCSSAKASPPTSRVCPKTKAARSWTSCLPTASGPNTSTATNGSRMIWCSGTTVR